MSVPTLSKTWQISANQNITSKTDSNTVVAAIARTLKNILKGFSSSPWTVSGSSNAGGSTVSPTGSAGMDAVDRWTVDADVATGGSNSRHAWIVLRQTGIATNYELCWDFINTGGLGTATFVVSPSAGFTGGSATARPTATDELVVISNGNWISNTNSTHKINVWQSTDGQCTRVVMWLNGTTLETFMLYDKPQNPVSGWTNPSVTSIYATPNIDHSHLLGGNTSLGRGTASMTIKYSGEVLGTQSLAAIILNIGDVPNDFDSTWPFYPIGLYSITASNRGRLGNLYDLWWKSIAINDGDTFPNSGASLQFVAFGPLIFPWTGDTTSPLLA